MKFHPILQIIVLMSYLICGCEPVNKTKTPIESKLESPWNETEIKMLSEKFGLHDYGPDHFHFPRQNFLREGYSPEGGYVKDFTILSHGDRWHVFHINGNPGETCWISGNEIAFGHASTTDFQYWIRHNMPIHISDNPWENRHIWAPFIYEYHDEYHMFYMGNGSDGVSICTAVSSDLEHWTKDESPIDQAPGRDPFVFQYQNQYHLLFTYDHFLGHCVSEDFKSWKRQDNIVELEHGAPESASIHELGDQYLIWYNGWNAKNDGKMYTFYMVSDNPLLFSPETEKEFIFQYDSSLVYVNEDFIVEPNNTCPISIELIKKDENKWLVAYFRPQDDRYKLFFAEMDITADPIVISEINSPEKIQKWQENLKMNL